MRFRRWPRVTAYEDTTRKRAALARSQRLQREKLPLFADLIAARQPSEDEEMARRAEWWPRQQQEKRDERANAWRRARARLAAFDDQLRPVIVALWRTCPYPADPVCLLDLLHQIAVGLVDPHRPPWKFHRTVSTRTTPNPPSFDEAFRQIGRKQVGGGSKTAPADEFLFCGNLGSGIIFLTSRVRLAEPNESFYTSSNHRLRGSHAGRSGHWVDIQIRGECTDTDLATIERLAQAADTRPVVVTRVRTLLNAGSRP
jgi:hypothetical protein